jgi:hypothetical protein
MLSRQRGCHLGQTLVAFLGAAADHLNGLAPT